MVRNTLHEHMRELGKSNHYDYDVPRASPLKSSRKTIPCRSPSPQKSRDDCAKGKPSSSRKKLVEDLSRDYVGQKIDVHPAPPVMLVAPPSPTKSGRRMVSSFLSPVGSLMSPKLTGLPFTSPRGKRESLSSADTQSKMVAREDVSSMSPRKRIVNTLSQPRSSFAKYFQVEETSESAHSDTFLSPKMPQHETPVDEAASSLLGSLPPSDFGSKTSSPVSSLRSSFSSLSPSWAGAQCKVLYDSQSYRTIDTAEMSDSLDNSERSFLPHGAFMPHTTDKHALWVHCANSPRPHLELNVTLLPRVNTPAVNTVKSVKVPTQKVSPLPRKETVATPKSALSGQVRDDRRSHLLRSASRQKRSQRRRKYAAVGV